MSLLFCENDFCIYQKNGRCILESINLNTLGLCTACIHINIEEKTLNHLKEIHLKDLNHRT